MTVSHWLCGLKRRRRACVVHRLTNDDPPPSIQLSLLDPRHCDSEAGSNLLIICWIYKSAIRTAKLEAICWLSCWIYKSAIRTAKLEAICWLSVEYINLPFVLTNDGLPISVIITLCDVKFSRLKTETTMYNSLFINRLLRGAPY